MLIGKNEQYHMNEITLFELWQKLRAGWRWLLGGAVVGLLGAGIVIGLMPNKYEASVLVQVGQVGQMGQVSQVGQVGQVSSQPIEPVANAVARLKSPAFQMRVASVIGDQGWGECIRQSSAGNTNILSVKAMKDVPLVEMKVRAGFPDKAEQIATAVVTELARVHTELAKPTLARLQSDLEIAKEKLAGAEKERDALLKSTGAAGIKDDRFTQLSLMTSLRVQKESEIYSQRQMVMALETALSEPATQTARAIEPVFVAEKPVSPRSGLLLALGLFGGLFAGMMAVFARNAWLQAKTGEA